MGSHLEDPAVNRALYVYDHLRWWRCVCALYHVLLGLQLEVYEVYEWPECFWALSRLLAAAGAGRKAAFALCAAQRLAAANADARQYVYRDCRFRRRWLDVLGPEAALEAFDQDMLPGDTLELELTEAEAAMLGALLRASVPEALLAFFEPDLAERGPADSLPPRFRPALD